MPPTTPASPEPPSGGETSTVLSPLGLDRLGLTQAIGGFALCLIALFSSYDHINFAGHPDPGDEQRVKQLTSEIAQIDGHQKTRSRAPAKTGPEKA